MFRNLVNYPIKDHQRTDERVHAAHQQIQSSVAVLLYAHAIYVMAINDFALHCRQKIERGTRGGHEFIVL